MSAGAPAIPVPGPFPGSHAPPIGQLRVARRPNRPPSGPLRAFQPQGHTPTTPLKPLSTPFPSAAASARSTAPPPTSIQCGRSVDDMARHAPHRCRIARNPTPVHSALRLPALLYYLAPQLGYLAPACRRAPIRTSPESSHTSFLSTPFRLCPELPHRYTEYLLQRPLISFQAKYIVRVLVDDLRRDGTLAAHRVDGHHRAVQLQQLQQLRDRRDLVRLVRHLALPQHQPLL